jgi:hypothetical protein
VTWFYQNFRKSKARKFRKLKNLLKHELKEAMGNFQHNHEDTLLEDKVVDLQGRLKGFEE